MKTCTCGLKLNRDIVDWIGIQRDGKGRASLRLYNCPNCQSTGSMKIRVISENKAKVLK